MFRARVRSWWRQCGVKEPPWREQRDPWLVLLAELMLRRTNRSQVVPVFEGFAEKFGDPGRLVRARESQVRELLRPLGLRWRVPAFRAVAGVLQRSHGSKVPRDYADLVALPGVGDYVASAVLAFGFDLPATLVDTNTVRIAARYFGLPYGPDSRRNPRIREHVALLFDHRHPRESAAAILDFGAVICTARSPGCERCPVRAACHYGSAK